MEKETGEELLNRFELSGLTQKAFCRDNNLSHKQFVYRWNARTHLRKKGRPEFETLTVQSEPLLLKESPCTLHIYLPNKISCEVILSVTAIKHWIEELAHVNPF